MAWRAAACVLTTGSTPLIKIVMPVLNQSIWHFKNTQLSGHFIYTAFFLLFSFGNRKVQGGDLHWVSELCLATVWRGEKKWSFNILNKYKYVTIIAYGVYSKATCKVCTVKPVTGQLSLCFCCFVNSQHNLEPVKFTIFFCLQQDSDGILNSSISKQAFQWL